MNRKVIFGCLSLFALAALCAGGIVGWRVASGRLVDSTTRPLFQGVEYMRDVRSSPRPLVIHVIRVDLQTAGIGTLVTPGDPKAELPLEARTTSEFLDEFGVQAAINGDAFEPWHANGIFDYYPHSGEPVDVIGLAISGGETYAPANKETPTLYFSQTNTARFNQPFGRTANALSGTEMLVINGKVTASQDEDLAPRSAVGLDRGGRTLLLVVVDGRQPGYSEGVSLGELAELLISYGARDAMNLDGGGSSTLVVEGPLGLADVLNRPIHNNVAGRERPVGNHLGIFARRE